MSNTTVTGSTFKSFAETVPASAKTTHIIINFFIVPPGRDSSCPYYTPIYGLESGQHHIPVFLHPLAFDFIAYESDDLILNSDFEMGALLSQARVERRLVDVPVPEGTKMSFYFVPQIETRNLAVAIHGLRYFQDPDPADGDDSGCFTALKEIIFEGGILEEHSWEYDSDGDGLADDFEISEGMDPDNAAVCDLEGLVYRSGIQNQGVVTSLAKKAENACEKHGEGQNHVAANMLIAFINEVGAQSGGHIPVDIANMLITFAHAASQALQ